MHACARALTHIANPAVCSEREGCEGLLRLGCASDGGGLCSVCSAAFLAVFQQPGVEGVPTVPQEPATPPPPPEAEVVQESAEREQEVRSWKAADETKEHAEAWRRRRSSASGSVQGADSDGVAKGPPEDEEDKAREEAIERARMLREARQLKEQESEQASS